MAVIVDLLHLLIVATGIGVGAWALIALRRSWPRGRFAIFGAASAGALFGCAALSGDVGLIPPTAWFAVLMSLMIAIVVAGHRARRAASPWS